jgi:RIO kinase 1
MQFRGRKSNLRYDTDYDLEDEDTRPVQPIKLKKKQGAAGALKPPRKASYESQEEVQHWLKEQALEDGGVKPEFNPTFLASRRDGPWILSSLAHFYEEDLITDVLHVIKSGKEATVYCCAAHPSTGAEYLAAKVYRPRIFRSLKNDVIYRQSREQHDQDGHIVRNPRRFNHALKKSSSGQTIQVKSWIEYEYATQRLLYQAGANVPRPYSHIGNAVLMEYIGEVNDPAPLLREVTLEKREAHTLFDCVMRNIALSLSCNRVHGDLSEYNMLYWRGALSIIDFAQAVDPHQHPAVYTLLLRDIERVCRYFARYGIRADVSSLTSELWAQYQ